MNLGWLKTFGNAVAVGVKVASPFAAAASSVIPGGAAIAVGLDFFTQASQALHQTEVMFAALFGPEAKKGPEKLKATAPVIAQLILQSESFAGKQIDDQAQFEEGTKELTSALVKIWNSVKPAQ